MAAGFLEAESHDTGSGICSRVCQSLKGRCRNTGSLPLYSLGLAITEPIQMQGEGTETLLLNERMIEFVAIFKLQNQPHGVLKG